MDQFHSSIPPWAHQPPASTTTAPYSAAFPTVTDAAPPPTQNYASQQQLPNFAAAVPLPPPPTVPSPAQAPEAISQPPGFHSSDPIPSYAQKMIFSAIAALKEPDGSSKRAITKYIDHFYPGLLPPALLTQTLQQLKTNGMLVMVKKSYKLPGSDFTPTANTLPDLSADVSIEASVQSQPQPPPPSSEGAAATTVSPSVGPKRGRGRPPKPKPDAVLSDGHQSQPEIQPEPGLVSQPETDNTLPPGFVPNGQTTNSYTSLATLPETQLVNVPMEVVDEANVVKRKPGRPSTKSLGVENGGIVIAKRGRGRPPGLKKRSPGRPRKPKPKTVAGVSGANGYKKRPGRPPKNNHSVIVPYDTTGEAIPQESVPRPRGRPRKGTGLIAAGVGVGGFSEKLIGLPEDVDDDVAKPRRSGRPVGRPKKYAYESESESEFESEPEPEPESDAEEDFRKKLEFFQSRVRGIFAVLKPQLGEGAPSNVVAAVGELEKLADLDIDQPLKEEQSHNQYVVEPIPEN
ncbi:hypothetical protein LINPERHAP1_LOCUS3279 [Linum perenne]